MNNFPEISYQMALQLKDLGFPQPHLAPDQAWYSNKEIAYFLYLSASGTLMGLNISTDTIHKYNCVLGECAVFAPTCIQVAEWLKTRNPEDKISKLLDDQKELGIQINALMTRYKEIDFKIAQSWE